MPPKSRRRPVSTDKRFRHDKHASIDHGPRERWQHSGRAFEPTERAGIWVARATEEHVIDILVMRGLLDSEARDAAFKFKLDYQRAGLAARVIGGYNPVSSARDYFNNAPVRGDFEEVAYRRWRNAVRAMGKLVSDVVISAVCHDLLPGPHSLPLLQNGLRKLADWYGLPKPDVRPRLDEHVNNTATR